MFQGILGDRLDSEVGPKGRGSGPDPGDARWDGRRQFPDDVLSPSSRFFSD